MEAPDITNFKLVDDFELFFDKGILRRKINLFMGSRKYDLCYKISPKLYAFLSLIIEPLKAGKINEAYECVSDYIIYDSFIKTIKKLSELGFNADFEKASLTPKKFDESELTMIRVFSIKGKYLNFVVPVSYKVFLIVYMVLIFFFTGVSVTHYLFQYASIDDTQLNLISYLPAYIISYMSHEFAHILVARLNHINVKSLTCAFYFDAIPTIFIKYDNIRFFSCKKRIQVSLAGVSVNFLFLLLSLSFYSSSNIEEFWGAMIYVNFMMIMSCMIPLKLGDGYFALCDLLGIDNLRKYIFSFITHQQTQGKVTAIRIVYLMAFLFFYIIAIIVFAFSALQMWYSSDGILQITIVFYLFFSLFLCGIVFIKKLLKEKKKMRNKH